MGTSGPATSTGSSTAHPRGKLYVYDEKWDRILVFLKSDGGYLSQWSTRGAAALHGGHAGHVCQPAVDAQGPVTGPPGTGHLVHDERPVQHETNAGRRGSEPGASPAPAGASSAPEPTRTPKPTKKPR